MPTGAGGRGAPRINASVRQLAQRHIAVARLGPRGSVTLRYSVIGTALLNPVVARQVVGARPLGPSAVQTHQPPRHAVGNVTPPAAEPVCVDLISTMNTLKGKSVFLSHNWADKTFARKLAWDLKTKGCQVWIDEGEMKPGDSLLYKITEGIGNIDAFRGDLRHRPALLVHVSGSANLVR